MYIFNSCFSLSSPESCRLVSELSESVGGSWNPPTRAAASPSHRRRPESPLDPTRLHLWGGTQLAGWWWGPGQHKGSQARPASWRHTACRHRSFPPELTPLHNEPRHSAPPAPFGSGRRSGSGAGDCSVESTWRCRPAAPSPPRRALWVDTPAARARWSWPCPSAWARPRWRLGQGQSLDGLKYLRPGGGEKRKLEYLRKTCLHHLSVLRSVNVHQAVHLF